MITALYPASIKFKVEERHNSQPQVRPELPTEYEMYRISFTDLMCLDYTFGCIITQEIRTEDWVLGWNNLFIKHQASLFIFSEQPMIALHFSLKGALCCNVEGYGSLAFMPNEFGFCYIPPKTSNPTELNVGTYESVYLSFSKRFFNKFIDQNPLFQQLFDHQRLRPQKGHVLPAFRIGYDERDSLNLIRSCQLKGPAREMYLGARITDLLINYFTSLEIADKEGRREVNDYESKIRDTAVFIQKNYHHPLLIPDLCRHAGMNITSFERGFKKVYGMLPRMYIEQVRVKKAAIMLKKTSVSIKDISYNVGFQAPHYFAGVFKKYYKCSPRQYRKKNLSMPAKNTQPSDEIL